MKILLTGSSGFVGSVVADFIVQNTAFELIRAQRMGVSDSTFSHGNITPNTNWSEGLLGVDVVIHLAGRAHVMSETEPNPLEIYRQINVASTCNLALQAARMGIKRFIFISTVKVHGEETGIDSPFTENSTYAPASDYAVSKMEAEVMLRKISQDSDMEVVIIRPPLVYGPSVSANFKRLIRLAASGFPLPLGGIKNSRSFVSVNNLTSLIVQCIDHPLAANQVFLVSDGCDVSTSELVKNLSIALGAHTALFRIPDCFWVLCNHFPYLRTLSHKMVASLRVDITKARNVLGWVPPYSFYDEIKFSVRKTIN